MDIGPILTFSGGALAFAAAALPIVSRAWRRAVARGTQHRMISRVLLGLSFVVYVGAVVARFALEAHGVASLLFLMYALIICVEFARRPAEMTRGEVIATVVSLIATYSLLSSSVAALTRHAEDQKAAQSP